MMIFKWNRETIVNLLNRYNIHSDFPNKIVFSYRIREKVVD